ncbi:hypothetical protein M409DRAFT_64431 [Zasmidium cellare ATCC 36951]|uniref:FAD dependent oxidoreductase domain-containing protein n=1 Tax=Zasmidium cellare ATCC 36951 TaxID=1080233 RepID=A0A6A6CS05_ZASCE|nr:uncharacterized protein M409DRAFT_64431 [Zasmidium cellare ATCC 36951]KAF2170057.1 hypothetical protein M409DRAFT_64431 [Zasmidium cellare ATCC 36951]
MDQYPPGLLLEAESFTNLGGWTLDSQFQLTMGSPYLLAHGNGTPVADASTAIPIPEAGDYKIYVRAKDWVPGHAPGRFQVLVDGRGLERVFGADGRDWSWEFGGMVRLGRGEVEVVGDGTPPEGVDGEAMAWRRWLRGLPAEPVDGGAFDVVVVGGGFVGSAAALTAARLGTRVALVQDRPVLGGNASVEIGLSPRGEQGGLVKELVQRHEDGDLVALRLLAAEKTATVFLHHTVYNATTSGSKIVSVDAREARTGREIRLSASTFIDCSGKAIFGDFAGAETLFGREPRSEYGESLAPVQADKMHHGNTVFFRTGEADHPVPFPPVPWATEVALDYADLGGQLITPGFENGPGPKVIPADWKPDPTVYRRMYRPHTHYWEYGQWLDPYTQAEHIRDHLLRAIYGTFSNVKTLEPEKWANLQFEHVAFVPGQGEFRRYKGPHILTEVEIRSHRTFEDSVVQNGSAFCLHYPGHKKYDFRLNHWVWDERDGKPFDVPFRSLYSSNVENLMMAGKHISVSHIVGSCTKFMGNGAQHAIATGVAAHLCTKHKTTPAGIYERHLTELQSKVAEVASPSGQRSHL